MRSTTKDKLTKVGSGAMSAVMASLLMMQNDAGTDKPGNREARC